MHLYHPLGSQKSPRLAQQVARNRGQECGNIELTGYLANTAGPVSLVLDLHITHERFGSSTDLSINGMDTYITLMMQIGHLKMRLSLTKLENIVLTIITTLLILSPS